MKVLLIEDDQELAAAVKKQLVRNNFAVDVVHTAEDGLFEVESGKYDCLVLDINLPDQDGFAVCRQLRQNKITTPILMATARDAIDNRIKGLNEGADDYIVKPFDSGELVARIRALIRRASKENLPKLTAADLVVDPQAGTVERGNKLLNLNPKEFAVLEFLLRHKGELVTRTMIMEHVWGSDYETLSNVVDVYIRYLRKKIDTGAKKPLIHTIRGAGYKLDDR